jgi:preprotein translocase subunit YajC
MAQFFSQYGLIIILAVLLIFMFWSSRRRQAKQKLEQEAKARQTVPGAEVLLQGGLYGTIVSYNPDNLDEPAIIELTDGVNIRVHSQAILRVVTPTEFEAHEHDSVSPEAEAAIEIPDHDDITPEAIAPELASDEGKSAAPRIESADETAKRLADEQRKSDEKKDNPEA